MPEKRKARGKVSVNIVGGLIRTGKDPALLEPVFVGTGFIVPKSFTAHWDSPNGTQADVEVEISGKRAVARKVTVNSTKGLGWRTLAGIPLRDVIATAILMVIQHGKPTEDGKIGFMPPAGPHERKEAWEVMRSLVGYKPHTEG